MVGGFKAESGPGLNTQSVNVGDGQDGSNSIGIPQWNGDRARSFLNYARTNGLDPFDINTQLQYSWLELNGPEKGTLQALMNPNLNPGMATAAALGYERPAGWSAQNPYGAKTFGSRLKNTVGLASAGFNTPFDGSSIGPNPNRFTPDQSQALPTFAASGQGSSLPQAHPFRACWRSSRRTAWEAAMRPRGRKCQQDAAGNALGVDGRSTALSYAGASPVAAAPAARAIAAAAPDDPLVSVPGYSGQWNKARIAAAPDGTDVPDDGELARAQGGAGAGPGVVQVPRGNALAAPVPVPQQPAPAAPPVAPSAVHAVMPQQSQSPYQVTPQLIQALLQNDDTRAFGIDMWKTLATTKVAPLVSNGYVLDGRTGQILYALPQKPEQTDAIKNFQFGQSNPAFQQYQADQQKGDKAQLVEVPLPNGQFQKAWATPGQIPSRQATWVHPTRVSRRTRSRSIRRPKAPRRVRSAKPSARRSGIR